jgi:hypothetical protein
MGRRWKKRNLGGHIICRSCGGRGGSEYLDAWSNRVIDKCTACDGSGRQFLDSHGDVSSGGGAGCMILIAIVSALSTGTCSIVVSLLL